MQATILYPLIKYALWAELRKHSLHRKKTYCYNCFKERKGYIFWKFGIMQAS